MDAFSLFKFTWKTNCESRGYTPPCRPYQLWASGLSNHRPTLFRGVSATSSSSLLGVSVLCRYLWFSTSNSIRSFVLCIFPEVYFRASPVPELPLPYVMQPSLVHKKARRSCRILGLKLSCRRERMRLPSCSRNQKKSRLKSVQAPNSRVHMMSKFT